MKKTKIIATIGPASWDKNKIDEMFRNGLNVVRINTSFANKEEILRVTQTTRSVSDSIMVLVDTMGHKIRTSANYEKIELKDNDIISISTVAKEKQIYFFSESETDLYKQISLGSTILIDDGLINLQVVEKKNNELVCKVIQGGVLTKSKTVNFPGSHITFPNLSKKDQNDILAGIEAGCDMIAMSFVRNKNDIMAFKEVAGQTEIKFIAKIENKEGVDNFDEILENCDGIMIARGDLGVEIPLEKVPVVQKEIIKKCNLIGKPVIVATQMLYSMISNPFPTRSEVNDVANAIYDGADAIMLSNETSTGKFPIEAVKIMNKIALEIEKQIEPVYKEPTPIVKPITNAIVDAAFQCARTLKIDKILIASFSGNTARAISRFKLNQDILVFTSKEIYKRQLMLSRGIYAESIDFETKENRDNAISSLVKKAFEKKFIKKDDMILIISGANVKNQNSTNLLEINLAKKYL